jgi:surface protein
MFESARAFNQDIETKSVSGIESSPYIAWNTSVVTNMSNMFNGALLFNQNIRFWSIISVTNMTNMLSGATAFAARYGTTTGYAETPLSIFFLFRPSTKQELINAVNAWTSRVQWQDVPNYPQWHVGSTNTDASGTSATTVTSSNNTHNSESRIKFQHISTTAFTLNFDYIVSAEAYYDFFRFFQSKDGGSLQTMLSTQYSSNNRYVAGTYSSGSTALTAGTYIFEFSYYKDYSVHIGNDNVQVSNINIGNTAAYNNVSISDWNTSLITDMSALFKDKTTFNDNISNWNTSAVTNMSYMFNGASAFNQNISGWSVSNVTNSTEIFTDCPISESNKPAF